MNPRGEPTFALTGKLDFPATIICLPLILLMFVWMEAVDLIRWFRGKEWE
jgi:hypothetical protein